MVQRLDVEFQSEGDTVRGWLYTPDEGGRRPTVVLAGGRCYVREVTLPPYAQKVAENGFNALIIDYRNLRLRGGARKCARQGECVQGRVNIGGRGIVSEPQ